MWSKVIEGVAFFRAYIRLGAVSRSRVHSAFATESSGDIDETAAAKKDSHTL